MPRPSVSVVVSASELFGPIRDLFNGLVLSRLEVARLLTEADIERILFDDTTAQPVTVTSRSLLHRERYDAPSRSETAPAPTPLAA